MPTGARGNGVRLGFVTAFPPGKNSLNEFGWHCAINLAPKPEVASLVIYADETADGPPTPIAGAESRVCWRFNSLLNPIRIAREVRRTKPDAVVLNLQFATFGDTKVAGGLGLLTPWVLKRMGVPTAVILHNLVENVDMQDAGFAGSRLTARVMQLAGWALTKALLKADYVALTIPRYVELLRSKYGGDNILLAPHGAFDEIDEPDFTTSAGPKKLLAFGKWGTYKTVDVLIEAYRELLSRGYGDIEVVIAGTDSPNSPGYLAGVEESCRDLPEVTFTGYVPEEDVQRIFTEAAVTVFPYTSTTGSSGVLHQAGSFGRCAVLPAIGDFAEVIEEEGFIGEYFEPGDALSLADALAKLLDDDSLREEMGRRNFAAASGIP
ncbi:MAG: glycosyltransferase, partial [Actinomycetota bacterium]